jgi:lysophospholipase L1-like esterase
MHRLKLPGGNSSAQNDLPLKTSITCLLLFCLVSGWRLSAAEPAPVIVAFGDSTTALRPPLTVYSTLLGERLQRELGVAVEVINAGVRGDTTRRAAARFSTDVLAKHPRLVIIQFGINDAAIDVWKDPPEKTPRVPRAEYEKNLADFLAACRRQGINVVLMTPNPTRWAERTLELYGRPPYDRNDPDGFNLNLRPYAETMRQLASKTGTPLVDVLRAHDDAAKAGGPELTDDGMHPNAAGQQLVTDLLMQVLRTHPELLTARAAKPQP